MPLVSIICLCYNHERFIEEAMLSALRQTYVNIELIVVDDASTDNSQQVIKKIVDKHPEISYLPLPVNLGNCAAFNWGLQHAQGEFVIDLAGDDVLYPDRVKLGIGAFQKVGDNFGVNFCNAEFIDEEGNFFRYHYPVNDEGKSQVEVPEGDVFEEVIRRYFICPPTVMFKMEVINALGGYDESLTYEDFDLWIRSSRKYKYVYTDQVLIKKRLVKDSLGQHQFKIGNRHLMSTYKVCVKISKLIRNDSERKALKQRLHYEIRLAIRLLSFSVAFKYLKLLKSL